MDREVRVRLRATVVLVSLAGAGALVAPRLEPGAPPTPPGIATVPRFEVGPPPPPDPLAGLARELPLLGAWVWDGCTLRRADLASDAGRWDLHVRTGYVPDETVPALVSAVDAFGLSGVHFGFYTRPRSLEPLRRWSDLRYLTFEGDHLTDAALAPLADLGALEMLEIGVRPYASNAVTDEGLRHLAPLRQLRYLGLHAYEGVHGPGLRHLAGLRELRELELSATGIGDDALRHLMPLRHLRTLSLQDTRVTDAGVRGLAALPELVTLDLRGTAVTPGIARELAAFPRLEHVVVHYNDQWDVIEAVRATGLRADADGWIRGTIGCEHW